MWEHGMPGSAWSMAADLLRWEELRDDSEDDLALAADPDAAEEPQVAGGWLLPRESRRGTRWGRRSARTALTGAGS
jgi:hypothetical protein